MSGYSGRRAPNFSQYLNDLNAPPAFYDQQSAGPQPHDHDLFDGDAELAMFTNAEFLDFDAMGGDLSAPPVGADFEDAKPAKEEQDVNYLDMLNDFKVPSYPYFSSNIFPEDASYPQLEPQLNTTTNNNSAPNGQTAIQPAPTPAAPTRAPSQTSAPATVTQASTPNSQKSTSGKSPTSQATTTNKRKQDPATLDDAARLAQEEDKRRRNTAASARFRIKKKEREKNLERTVKEVTTKNSTLEARVSQLEMENRWLRNLITEKNDSTISEGDLSGMFNKFREGNEAPKAGEKTGSS